jgi:hypothetical protein
MQAASQMMEYELVLASVRDGALTLDVHAPQSSGTSHVLEFESPWALRDFLAGTGLSDEKLQEIDTISQRLQHGDAFHGQMFLPTVLEDRIKEQLHRRAA